jgi:hypothetical protein
MLCSHQYKTRGDICPACFRRPAALFADVSAFPGSVEHDDGRAQDNQAQSKQRHVNVGDLGRNQIVHPHGISP